MNLHWQHEPDYHKNSRRYKRRAEGKVAKDFLVDSKFEISATVHHSGSGPGSFGFGKDEAGEKERDNGWPALDMQVSFTVAEGDKARDEFADALQEFITNYFSKK